MRFVVLVLFAAALSSCVSVAPLATVARSTETVARRERNYEIGAEQTVVVGNPVVRVRDYNETVTTVASMEATEAFVLSGGPVSLQVGRGERLPVVGQRSGNGVTYTVVRKDRFGIQIAPDGSVAPGLINGLGTETQVVMVYQFTATPASARFVRADARHSTRTPTGQNFEIVFNGIDGQAMRFQYREYTADDMARPAFFQDLSYPLGTRTLRFRSLAIDVAAIDAQQMRYTVQAD